MTYRIQLTRRSEVAFKLLSEDEVSEEDLNRLRKGVNKKKGIMKTWRERNKRAHWVTSDGGTRTSSFTGMIFIRVNVEVKKASTIHDKGIDLRCTVARFL